MPRRKLAPNRGVPTTPADADEDEGERPSLTDTELNAKSQRNLLAGKKLAEIEPVTSPERPLIAPPSRTMSTRSDDGLVLLSTATRSVPLEHAAAALGDVPGGDGESDEDAYDEEQTFPMLQSCFCGAFDYDLVDLSTIYEEGEPHEDGATVGA